MKPYSIWLPQFDPTSGGIRVMWGLYGALLLKGQIVIPNAQFQGDSIAIYPEIAQGNPLEGSTVVRYILNKPGVMSASGIPGPTSFNSSDKLYYFSRLFGETDDNHYMFLPILNTHLFKDQGKKRTKKAVFIGKGASNLTAGENFGEMVVIDRQFAQDQQALADLLNETTDLYCYDPVTAMTEIARLCGCRVIIIPSTYTKEEFKKYEPGMDGINWSKDEGIKLNTKAFRDRYESMKQSFNYKLDIFITETQK